MINVNEEMFNKFRDEGRVGNYRKKPVVIEAVKMDEDFVVETLEGTMVGARNDYLLKGVDGELYPCRDLIFKKTYEQV
jgi:hypothetical protein